ncbi:MAG: ABC transporter substrate-binding protein [Pseudomonadota bacterium]
MKFGFSRLMSRSALVGGAVAAALVAAPAIAKDKIDVAVTAFLTGPAAGPFGVPGKQGAELIINAINGGTMPAPYNTKGFAGAMLNPLFTDESGGGAKQVGEYRNLVQKRNVDAVVGYISSGSCMAITPVAEELKKLTIFSVCGTPRVFEEGNRTYVFRTQAHAVGDSIAAAHYVAEKFPDVKGFTGINQNYAWGQDSWKFFKLAMAKIKPSAEASSKPQFPKIFAGQYGTEISALSTDKAEMVHSSFWDGDIEAFVVQGLARGFFRNKKFVSVVGGSAIDSLGKKFPDGVVMGTRGEGGILLRHNTAPLNAWFVSEYKKAYGVFPLGPSYQYANAILALKMAMDNAAKAAGGFPTQEQTMAALKGIKYQGIGGEIALTLGNGHQAVHPVGYGITKWDKEKGEPTVTDVKFYGTDCIYAPPGKNSEEWLNAGMPGAKC